MPELSYKVNLLPPKLQREETIDLRRLLLVTGVALLVAALVGGYGVFIFSLLTAKNELAATKAQLTAVTPLATRVKRLRLERIELQQTAEDYRKILGSRREWSGLLTDINRVMPVDLWLNDLELTYQQSSQKASGQNSQAGVAQPQAAPKGTAAVQVETLPRPNVVFLKGSSRTVASIGVFINSLSRLPYFQEVRLNKVQEGTDGIQFEIIAFLKKV
ncbi:MAG: PilN domain-containing protein [Thermacetogeniaceae bacterium]